MHTTGTIRAECIGSCGTQSLVSEANDDLFFSVTPSADDQENREHPHHNAEVRAANAARFAAAWNACHGIPTEALEGMSVAVLRQNNEDQTQIVCSLQEQVTRLREALGGMLREYHEEPGTARPYTHAGAAARKAYSDCQTPGAVKPKPAAIFTITGEERHCGPWSDDRFFPTFEAAIDAAEATLRDYFCGQYDEQRMTQACAELRRDKSYADGPAGYFIKVSAKSAAR